jgi:hypothetical protein
MDALAPEKGSLTLLDLPKAVLQDILSQCGPASTRYLHSVHIIIRNDAIEAEHARQPPPLIADDNIAIAISV